MNYRVNDVYTAIQGEGCQTGTPMVLLRLHGCSVGCPWCDTKETWQADPANACASIAEARGANVRYAIASANTIAQHIRLHHPGPSWVLLTGGEPAEQGLGPLVEALHDAGYQVAIETSGTAPGLLLAQCDWVCVSPKIGMPGKRAILPEMLALADEIKMVVGKAADIQNLEALLSSHPTKPGVQICLQPLSQNERATQLCIETVQARGWRLSVQLHKLLRLP